MWVLILSIRIYEWNQDVLQSIRICHELAHRANSGGLSTIVGRFQLFREGVVRISEGRVFLADSRKRRFFGEIRLRVDPQWAKYLLAVSTLQVEGRFSCRASAQNKPFLADWLNQTRLSSLRIRGRIERIKVISSKREVSLLSLHNWTKGALLDRFSEFPWMRGLIIAVWTGDRTGLPPPLADFYLRAGLVQVLALSGQHVVILCALCYSLFYVLLFVTSRLGFPMEYSRWLSSLNRQFPLICAAVLLMTGYGEVTIQRTFFSVCCFVLIRWRALFLFPNQALCSSIAIGVLWDPEHLFHPGYLLSSVASLLLLETLACASFRKVFLQYLRVSVLMPVLMLPCTAVLFGKTALLAPLFVILLSWFWDLCLIPMGFLSVWVGLGLPDSWAEVIFGFGETAVALFFKLHEPLYSFSERYYVSVVRPNLLEFVFMELLLVFLLLRLGRASI